MKSSIVWLSAITCNGNTHSFLAASPQRLEMFLHNFYFLYHPSLTFEVELDDILKQEQIIDFLVIEGAVSKSKDIHSLGTKSTYQVLKKLAKKARYILCAGSCAAYGGIHKQLNPQEIFSVNEALGMNYKSVANHKIINISGCPLHPEWLIQTLLNIKKFGFVDLDKDNRPLALYASMAHHGCNRNEYFEWKVEAKSFGLKEGCLFYNEGCQGPMTHSSCNTILWNEVSSKTKVGMPCIGCTESDFPKVNLFSTKKFMGIPAVLPQGISTRGYLAMAGVAKTFHIERLHNRIINEKD